MGRELRRVPMDFDHPIGEVWPGYLSPDYRPCPDVHCERGYTKAEPYVEGLAYLIDLMGEAATTGAVHPWLTGIPVCYGEYAPSPDIIDWIKTIAPDWEHQTLGGGQSKIARALLQMGGRDLDDWECPTCKGHGIHPDDIAASEAWEPTEHPTGEGFQMWETTSEGSPKTPVFASLKELAEYCAANCTTFADFTASAEGWEQMLGDGFVSTVIAPGVIAL